MGLFQIIKCYSCNMFQVHPVKKAKDWKCKICGEKQNLKRIYFESNAAKDCRLQVQQLNMKKNRTPSPQPILEIQAPPTVIKHEDSKWKKFKTDQEEVQDNGDDLFSSLEKMNSKNVVPPKSRAKVVLSKKSNADFKQANSEKYYSKPKTWHNSKKASKFDRHNPNPSEKFGQKFQPLDNFSTKRSAYSTPLLDSRCRNEVSGDAASYPSKPSSLPQPVFSEEQKSPPKTTKCAQESNRWSAFPSAQPVQTSSKWAMFNTDQDNDEDDDEGTSIW